MIGRRTLLLLGTLAACGVTPAGALASPADVAATQSYVQANYRLVQNAGAHISVGEAALRGVLEKVRHECPRAAAGSPQDPESTQLSNEVVGAMVTAAIHPDLGSIREYLRAAGHLHWSNRGLTRTIQTYVGKLRKLSTLPQPNLCADVRSWAASGFHSLPAANVAFAEPFMASWVALGELPGSLAQFERGEQRSLISRSNQRETQLTDFEAQAVTTWGEIMNVLELNP